VDGALRHTDELGSRAVVSPGIVQRLAAGSGVRHSETNASPADTRYLQMWLAPTSSGPPEYGTATVTGSGFVVVASGRTADAPLSLRAPATFSVARLAAGERATLEAAAFVHLSVVRGPVALTVDKAPTGDTETVSVSDGDTVRITGAAAIFVQAVAGAEVLAWSMDSSLHR
jgi:redox-sensitive bicupin YhaK (pirin superfamily)